MIAGNVWLAIGVSRIEKSPREPKSCVGWRHLQNTRSITNSFVILLLSILISTSKHSEQPQASRSCWKLPQGPTGSKSVHVLILGFLSQTMRHRLSFCHSRLGYSTGCISLCLEIFLEAWEVEGGSVGKVIFRRRWSASSEVLESGLRRVSLWRQLAYIISRDTRHRYRRNLRQRWFVIRARTRGTIWANNACRDYYLGWWNSRKGHRKC